MTAISFRHLEAVSGHRLDGVLGADFLRQFVVEIDYAGRRLHLHDPKSWSYKGTGHPLAFDLTGPIPIVEAVLNDTIPARFHVDTGARMAVKASRSFVELAGLEALAGRVIEGPPGMGIGGATPSTVGRFDKLTLAGFELPRPLVHLGQDTGGNFAHSDVDGVIGGEVWRRFRVILDYPNKRMYLEPNADFDQPFDHDMSGLAVRVDSLGTGALLVSQVLSGSPAEVAGLRTGDRIESMNDRPVTSMTLSEFREELRIDGREVTLVRRRGDLVESVRLTLRRLI